MVNENEEILKKEMVRINDELMKNLNNYRKTLTFMIADAPISCLCLSKATETLLINDGCLRIYDLFDRDFVEIKGFGETRVRDLTARLNEFFSMS